MYAQAIGVCSVIKLEEISSKDYWNIRRSIKLAISNFQIDFFSLWQLHYPNWVDVVAPDFIWISTDMMLVAILVDTNPSWRCSTSPTWEGEPVGSTFRSTEFAGLFVESSTFVYVRDVIGDFSIKIPSTCFVCRKKYLFLKRKTISWDVKQEWM